MTTRCNCFIRPSVVLFWFCFVHGDYLVSILEGVAVAETAGVVVVAVLFPGEVLFVLVTTGIF